MVEDSISERMKWFIRSKGLNINDFEKIVGWPPGTVRKMTDSFKRDRFDAVVEKFPDFDVAAIVNKPASTYTHPMVTDSAVVKETMASHYSAVHQNAEHDMLIKSTTMIDSMKAIVRTIDDPSLAINLIGQILGVTPPKE